jgi:hypothetical protein
MSKPLEYIRETCYFCTQDWDHCTCKWPGDSIGFNTEDFFITDPNVSECGRFFVDPVKYYGTPYVSWVANLNI